MSPLRTLPDEAREFLEDIQANQIAIRRSQKRQNIVTGVLILILAAGVVFFLLSAAKTHDALCSLRGDLQTRVRQSQQFLDHPETFPSIRMTPALRAQIETQVDGQKHTIAALEPLGCD